MHIYAEQTACDYACMCMWLRTSMLCSQLVTMYARAWAMHLYAMQSSCDYACLCMWLCTSMPCSQFVTLHAWACGYACMCMWLFTSMLCCQLVTTYAWACEYVHLCHAFSYANDSLVVSGPLNWLIQQTIPFNRLCTFMLCSQLITMYAWAYEYVHLCHAFSYANDSLVVSGPINWLIQQTISSWEKYLVLATYLIFLLNNSVSKRISCFDHPFGLLEVTFF